MNCCFWRVAPRVEVVNVWARKGYILPRGKPLTHSFPKEKLDLLRALQFPDPIP